jgi:hypothetical protein
MWKLFFKKNNDKWQPFTDTGNADANAKLNGNPREHTFYIEHIWQNGYGPAWKTTWYYVDVREKSQENQEPNGNFTKRAIKITWSEDPWPDFDFETWVRDGPPRPPNAAAAQAPAATTATTGGGGGGANTSMATEASTAPTVSETSAGPSTHDPIYTSSDQWTKAKNYQRKDWHKTDDNWQGSQARAWQNYDDKANNMAGMYNDWPAGQYSGPSKKDGGRAAASTVEQPATQESQAAIPPPGLEGQASTHKSHDNSPAAWPHWDEVQATEQKAIATETTPKVRDEPIAQEAMPESQAITQEIIMKSPPPPLPSTLEGAPQHPKPAPPVCPIAKSLPQGLGQMGSDDSSSSLDGNQQGSDGSTKAAPLPADASEEVIASLSEQVARLTSELDDTKRAALSGKPIPLPLPVVGRW